MLEVPLPAAVVRSLVEERIAAAEDAARALARRPLDEEPVHEMRKAARRLEASLALAEWCLKPTRFVAARHLAQKLPRGLGKHRDADVQRARMTTLAAEAPEGLAEDLLAIARSARPGRKKRRADAERVARRARPKRLRAPLLDLLAEPAPDAQGDALALPALRVRARLAHARFPGAGDDALHALRLDAKLLRYGLEALAEAGLAETADAAREAETFTDALGRVTDAMAQRALGARHLDAHPQGARWLVAHAERSERAARRAFHDALGARTWPALDALLRR